jgi:hypothetical protein
MRPYLVLCGLLLTVSAAFGQEGFRHPGTPFPPPPFFVGGNYGYGYGPYSPLAITPMISFETVSPNPVGASNATTGLVAGATNSTLSEVAGSTSSDYTVAVWYQGGAPLTTPEVNILPEPIGHQMHGMRGMSEEHGMREMEGREHARSESRGSWVYFSGTEYTAPELANVAKGPGKGVHKYTNEDVTRQNEKNGNVHYDGKTEKIQ